MSEIILSSALPVPKPREELSFRLATTGDIPWMDALQKQYNKALGFMYESWFEGKIARNEVLIAETGGRVSSPAAVDESASGGWGQPPSNRVGYIIAQDRYMKRDDLGIVYQLVVEPGKQRGFIGAALLKAQFDRSAYGCRMYCCWCAQDLDANHFWESMGFYPLAYRNGSETRGKNGKPRVQIFWEKKIRGNEDGCHWWFPAKTEGGAMLADRLALPIPPGVHWSEVEPIEIPMEMTTEPKQLASPMVRKKPAIKPIARMTQRPSRMSFATEITPIMKIEEPKPEKKPRPRKPKVKIDPKFIRMSRELRDRYLEEVNEKGFKLESAGKYELTRDRLPVLESPSRTIRMIEAA